jgi:hypothetical protein
MLKCLFFAALFLSELGHSATKKVVYCYHEKVCELALFITDSIKIEPTEDEAILKEAAYVILPSSELSPKGRTLTAAREKKSLQTIKVYLPTNHTKLYKVNQNLNDREVAQFWYFPDLTLATGKLLCSQLKEQLHLQCHFAEDKLLTIQKDLQSLLQQLKKKKIFFKTNTPFDLWLKRIQLYSDDFIIPFAQNSSLINNFEQFIATLKQLSEGKSHDHHQKN